MRNKRLCTFWRLDLPKWLLASSMKGWTPTDTIEETKYKHSKPDLNLVVGGFQPPFFRNHVKLRGGTYGLHLSVVPLPVTVVNEGLVRDSRSWKCNPGGHWNPVRGPHPTYIHTWATKKTRPYFPLNPGCLRTGSFCHGLWNNPHITRQYNHNPLSPLNN